MRRTCRQPSPKRMIMTRGSMMSSRMTACVSTSATMPPLTKEDEGSKDNHFDQCTAMGPSN
jgi:hypothetical protein